MKIPARRVRELFARFSGCRILIVGDLMLDEYLWGQVSRISPEAPVPVVELDGSSCKLGGATNVALNVKALGATPVVIGVRGKDHQGRQLISEVKRQQISANYILVDRKRPTTTKTRIIAHNQQVVRADREMTAELAPALSEKLLAMALRELPKVDALIISDYGKGVITFDLLRALIKEANSRAIPICVDPKETHFNNYQRVTAITPNHHEASFAYGKRISDEQSLCEVGQGLLTRLNCQSVLITRGDKGMSLFEKNDSVIHIPATARKVYDVTGAGDTVVSTFTVAVAAGATLKEAALISNTAAGIVVGELGTAQASKSELYRELCP